MQKSSLVLSSVGLALGRVNLFLQAIRFEQSLFALPLAYLALFLAEDGLPSGTHFLWITLAMVGIRTFGMGANRLIDADLDARNPRTAARGIPSGLLAKRDVLALSLAGLALFAGAAYQLEPLAHYLWPVVAIVIATYPYGKRFTWACNLWLGLVFMMVPPGVWLAVTNELPAEAILLGVATGSWAAGFDILYSTMDARYDAEHGIHSIAADLGISVATWVARVLHLMTWGALLATMAVVENGAWFVVGLISVGVLLAYEHGKLAGNVYRIADPFFTRVNVVVSFSLFLFVAIDTLVR